MHHVKNMQQVQKLNEDTKGLLQGCISVMSGQKFPYTWSDKAKSYFGLL